MFFEVLSATYHSPITIRPFTCAHTHGRTPADICALTDRALRRRREPIGSSHLGADSLHPPGVRGGKRSLRITGLTKFDLRRAPFTGRAPSGKTLSPH